MVGSEVLTPVVVKSAVFWDITLCSPLEIDLALPPLEDRNRPSFRNVVVTNVFTIADDGQVV
jgi:hypothetical protein